MESGFWILDSVLSTFRAEAKGVKLNVMNFKVIRSLRQFQRGRFVQSIFKVTYALAGLAERVSVFTDIGIVMCPLGVQAEFLDLAHVPQGLKGFVNGSKGDRRVDLEDIPVYVLRRWMAVVSLEELENAQSLRRYLQTDFPKSFNDLFDIFHLFPFPSDQVNKVLGLLVCS